MFLSVFFACLNSVTCSWNLKFTQSYIPTFCGFIMCSWNMKLNQSCIANIFTLYV